MVWAAFCGTSKSALKFLSGKVDSARYIATLHTHLQPFIDVTTHTFQQDNAPCHSSRQTKEWLEANNIKVMPWPAYSPDMHSPTKCLNDAKQHTLFIRCHTRPQTLAHELHTNCILNAAPCAESLICVDTSQIQLS